MQKRVKTLKNCKGCYHHDPEVHSIFTTKSHAMKAAAKKNPFTLLKQFKTPSPSASTLKDVTAKIYNQIKKPFLKVFDISFAEAQSKVSVLQLQKNTNEDLKETAAYKTLS